MRRSLNLISDHAQKREQVRRCVRLWSRILVAVIVTLIITGLTKWQFSQQEYAKQVSAEADYEPIRQLKIENGRLRKQIASLQKAESFPLELAQHQPLFGLLGLATQVVAEQDGMVYLRQIEIERAPINLQQSGQSNLSFELEGFSTDSGSVTRLVDSLRKVGPFAKVELSANNPVANGQQTLQSFAIQCAN